jgi:hypothetical protein
MIGVVFFKNSQFHKISELSLDGLEGEACLKHDFSLIEGLIWVAGKEG